MIVSEIIRTWWYVVLISVHEEAEVIDILEGDAGAFGDRVQWIFGDMEVNRHLIGETLGETMQ